MHSQLLNLSVNSHLQVLDTLEQDASGSVNLQARGMHRTSSDLELVPRDLYAQYQVYPEQ